MFSSKDLEKTLNDHFDAQSLRIRKKFLHVLSITGEIKPFHLLMVVQGGVYDMSSKGIVLRQLEAQSRNALTTRALQAHGKDQTRFSGEPVIFFDDVTQPQPGAQVVSRDTLTLAVKIFQLCSDGGLKPLYLSMKKDDPTIEVTTQEGWRIIFTQLDDGERQYNDARIVLAKYFSKDRKGLHYIDVRFDNRVYYQ